MPLIAENEFLIIKIMASEMFRSVIPSRPGHEATMEDVRSVVLGSTNDPEALVVAGTWVQHGHQWERWEKIRCYIREIPVEYVLKHTQQKAPDGEKFVVFLESLERLVARPTADDNRRPGGPADPQV